MTKCWRASSPWPWSAPAASAAAAASPSARACSPRRVAAGLGFNLTGAQRMAIAEISAEMAQPRRMMRLLQGDVGSGKTVVALMAMLGAVESGAQAALMAPTEILARQHQATLRRLAAPAGIEIGLLTGREKGRARDATLAGLASGLTAIVVGTHALLQPDVVFRDLALAVIDEQHRFGVEQRLALAEKGRDADTLLMSATPIPRTLMMTAYGDLDASRLTEKPPGRQPIDTRTVALERLDEVVAAVSRALAQGAKAYWICPLVDESEDADLAAARERSKALESLMPGTGRPGPRPDEGRREGPGHGRIRRRRDRPAGGDDGDRGRRRRAGRDGHGDRACRALRPRPAAPIARPHRPRRPALDLPVAVPLAVGRRWRGNGSRPCARPMTAFRIAEEDLRLRGAGEVLGTRQSGLPTLRLADLAAHAELIAIAHDDARLVLDRDPQLETPRGQALRTLLYLFRRDEAVQYLRAG